MMVYIYNVGIMYLYDILTTHPQLTLTCKHSLKEININFKYAYLINYSGEFR